jgi:hypothetical protein
VSDRQRRRCYLIRQRMRSVVTADRPSMAAITSVITAYAPEDQGRTCRCPGMRTATLGRPLPVREP